MGKPVPLYLSLATGFCLVGLHVLSQTSLGSGSPVVWICGMLFVAVAVPLGLGSLFKRSDAQPDLTGRVISLAENSGIPSTDQDTNISAEIALDNIGAEIAALLSVSDAARDGAQPLAEAAPHSEHAPITAAMTSAIDHKMHDMQRALSALESDLADTRSDLRDAASKPADSTDDSEPLKQVIEQVSISAEQIRALLGDTGAVADELANETRDSAMGVFEAVRKTNAISKQVNELSGLSAKAGMLAINASIEASRAGEMGAGFAIVSREFGDVASRVGAAATAISKLSAESLDAANGAGVALDNLVPKTQNALNFVNEASRNNAHQIELVSAAMAGDASFVTAPVADTFQADNEDGDEMADAAQKDQNASTAVELF